MKEVLGIIASPRRLGNCELLVKEIIERIPEPHRFRLLRLSDFNIQSCRGCYSCLFGEQRCVLKDDFQQILDAIRSADGIVLAAPAYFLGANAALKRFIDRGLAFYAHIEEMWATPSVGVAVAGIPGMEGHTLLGLENFLSFTLTSIRSTAVVYGALPGEVFFDEQNKNKAASLGTALFGGTALLGGTAVPDEKATPTEPACPLCGGSTFRFLGAERVRCMLCSNEGVIGIGTHGLSFEMRQGEHPMFLSKEAALAHRTWLQGMKEKFIEQKSALKSVCLPYLKQGEWIKPLE